MSFSKDLLRRLTSPDILKTEPEPRTFEQAAIHFERLGLRVELEERAAILEYDGGLCREAAERQAVMEMLERE